MILGEVPAPEATLTPTEGIIMNAANLAEILGLDAAVAVRLFAVASAMVAEYCPTAPDPIRDEAIVRTSAYLREMPGGSIQRLQTGGVEIEFQKPSGRSALRFSGSMSLLSPYKVRRGMVIR